MAIGDIFSIPVKESINVSLQGKSFIVCGKSKSGKSTLCSQAPRPVFLMTENGGEGLVGFTPVPISSWSDFRDAVNQLCLPQGREHFDTVVIDTYTNLILLLDKFIGQRLTTEKNNYDFGSDVDYGKGAKGMRNELGIQLQKLANQGYLLLNIVHAEDKVDFDTQKTYIGTSLSNSLYGVAEKFVDQIVYLRRDRNPKTKNIEYRTYFNAKGGFLGAGGRFTPQEDSVETSFENLEGVMIKAIEQAAKDQGAETIVSSGTPSVIIKTEEDMYNFDEMMEEFKQITDFLVNEDKDNAPDMIKSAVERELGIGKKVNQLNPNQAELLANVLKRVKELQLSVKKEMTKITFEDKEEEDA